MSACTPSTMPTDVAAPQAIIHSQCPLVIRATETNATGSINENSSS